MTQSQARALIASGVQLVSNAIEMFTSGIVTPTSASPVALSDSGRVSSATTWEEAHAGFGTTWDLERLAKARNPAKAWHARVKHAPYLEQVPRFT